MKRILKKVEVSFISLVGKGANGKTIIYKSANHADNPAYSKEITILKTDPEKQIVYGIVYSPDEVDSQGDTASAKVIEEMAYEFMKSARTMNVDQQHDFKGDEGFVAESWILKQTDALFPDEKPGSWAVGIKVTNGDTWERVKKGEITGLSLAGAAVVEEVKSDNILNKLRKWLGLEKDFDAEVENRELRTYVMTLEDALFEIMNDETVTDKKAAIMETLGQFVDAMSKLNLSNITKAGKVISAKNLTKLKSALTELQDLIAAAEQEEINKSGKENEMTPDEIKAAIKEAITPLEQKIDTLEKNADLLKAQGERIEALEKSSPGSQQKTGNQDNSKATFGWLQ